MTLIRINNENIISLINRILEEEKDELIAKISDSLMKEHKSWQPSKLFTEARNIVAIYESNNMLCSKVSGKIILSRLSDLCKRLYNVSFSVQHIIYEMNNDEIDDEIVEILTRIHS